MGFLDSLRSALFAPKVTVARPDITVSGSAEDVIPPLVAQLKELRPIETRRGTTARYFEGVITRDRLADFCAVLEAVLGAPAKPFGQRVGFDAALDELVDGQGGIAKDQCLYLRGYETDDRVAFAALWPWDDGKSITLKVGIHD